MKRLRNIGTFYWGSDPKTLLGWNIEKKVKKGISKLPGYKNIYSSYNPWLMRLWGQDREYYERLIRYNKNRP
jgi:hypothetical protein